MGTAHCVRVPLGGAAARAARGPPQRHAVKSDGLGPQEGSQTREPPQARRPPWAVKVITHVVVHVHVAHVVHVANVHVVVRVRRAAQQRLGTGTFLNPAVCAAKGAWGGSPDTEGGRQPPGQPRTFPNWPGRRVRGRCSSHRRVAAVSVHVAGAHVVVVVVFVVVVVAVISCCCCCRGS